MKSLWLQFAFVLLTGWFNAHGASLDHWHWRNPAPFANSLRSSCFAQGHLVAVGDGGIVHSSPDGVTWDEGRRPVVSTLRKVIYANGQFVAVGHDGAIITSPDGYSWTVRTSGTTDALYSVAYGNGKYMACGQNGRLVTSADGVLWVPGSIGTTDLTWIAFGRDLFLLQAPDLSNGQLAIRTSADGETWTTRGLPANGGYRNAGLVDEAIFANGQFVVSAHVEFDLDSTHYLAVRFITSPDGTNWAAGAYTPVNNSSFVHHFLTALDSTVYDYCAYLSNPDNFSYLSTTADGTSLTAVSLPSAAAYGTSLSSANGRLVMTALDGYIWTRTGMNWTANPSGWRHTLTRIIRGADRLLVLGTGTGALLITSLDGLSFEPLPGSPVVSGRDIAFDGSNYVAVAEDGVVYSSTDASNWVQRASNTSSALRAVCRGPNRWVAVGASGTIITSPNALAWTLRVAGTARNLKGVAWGNGTFVAVGDSGSLITSPDGTTWDAQYSGTLAGLTCVRFLNGRFLAVGAGGTVLTSTDGGNWQSHPPATERTLTDIAFGDGRFVVCGADKPVIDLPDPMRPGAAYWPYMNVLLQSTNGNDWEDISTRVPVQTGLNAVAFLDGSFWLCGENGALLQSDSVDGIPRFKGAMLPRNAGFQLTVTLNAPPVARIQTCADLGTDAWQDAGTLTNGIGLPLWTDTDAVALPRRFYRLVAP